MTQVTQQVMTRLLGLTAAAVKLPGMAASPPHHQGRGSYLAYSLSIRFVKHEVDARSCTIVLTRTVDCFRRKTANIFGNCAVIKERGRTASTKMAQDELA